MTREGDGLPPSREKGRGVGRDKRGSDMVMQRSSARREGIRLDSGLRRNDEVDVKGERVRRWPIF